jgi:hypothetical protein
MHYLQPLADFLAQYWWVWLICMFILFAVRVRLVPKSSDSEEDIRNGRPLRIPVGIAMVAFAILTFLSIAAVGLQQLDVW